MLIEPAVKNLAIWHRMVEQQDFTALPDILHPEAIFRSPMAHHPYQSAMAVCVAINAVATLFQDFTYEREYHGQNDQAVILEFSARLDQRHLKGIDLFTFSTDGRIKEMEVMIRPLNALSLLGTKMAALIGDTLPKYKNEG
ncbi:MAG: nuclear transport factor 2 family protein [bacterium]